jgi:hypothetical protein
VNFCAALNFRSALLEAAGERERTRDHGEEKRC